MSVSVSTDGSTVQVGVKGGSPSVAVGQRGPQGPPGPAGPTGPEGPQGVTPQYWDGTEAEYLALDTYDPDTLYIVFIT